MVVSRRAILPSSGRKQQHARSTTRTALSGFCFSCHSQNPIIQLMFIFEFVDIGLTDPPPSAEVVIKMESNDSPVDTSATLGALSIVPIAPSPSFTTKLKSENDDEKSSFPIAFPMETIDRYGFLVSDKRFDAGVRPPDSSPERRAAVWLENRRTQKWVRMIGKQLEDWEVCQLRHASTLKKRIRKGIPEALRGRVWGHLAGASLMLRNNPGVYPSLLAADDAGKSSASSSLSGTTVTDTISRDIGRTFPKHYLFQAHRAGQGALFNVLRAYAQYDPEVGYCQGMGFLAAMFLSYMPEPQAFWLLVACLNHRRFALADLYRPRMPKVPELLFVCEHLMKTRLPRLAKHLEAEGLHPTMYLTQWLLTLYAYNFPFAFVTRVWDAFLHEGWKVIFRVAIALLQLAQPKLLQIKFEAIMDFFRDLPNKVDTEEALAAAFKLPLKRSQIEQLREQFQQQQQEPK